jgi:hypothetical protein
MSYSQNITNKGDKDKIGDAVPFLSLSFSFFYLYFYFIEVTLTKMPTRIVFNGLACSGA